jgi:hypothetical protein
LNRKYRNFPRALSSTRFLIVLLVLSMRAGVPGVCEAKENCPWLNEATAAGALEGPVTATVTHPNNNKDDATCAFTHRNGAVTTGLQIEVETMSGAPGAFAEYVGRCGANSVPVKAIGNEAVACSFDDRKKKGWVSEQVVGRVRDRAFTVRISSNAESPVRSALREEARKIAEQVAGFLF